jgi:tetratricopeptide (TPR) repeat protein
MWLQNSDNRKMQTDAGAINACKSCRSQHKKCDKKLPMCSRCSRNKRECVYHGASKRGPKSNSQYGQPYPSLSVKVTQHGTNSSDPLQSMYLRQPFIPQERFFRAMNFVENELNNKENTITPESDDLMMIYSIKACVLKTMQQIEQAAALFEKARTLVMSNFDQILKSFLLAACSLFLGTYCILDNDLERAMFFLENVRLFFVKNTNVDDPSVSFLRLMYDDVALMAAGDGNIERQLKSFMTQMYSMNQHVDSQEKVFDLSFIEIDKIQSDLALNTDLYDLNNQRMTIIRSRLDDMYDTLRGKVPNSTVEMIRLVTSFYIQGAIAQRSFRMGQLQVALEAADKIAQMTTSKIFEVAYVTLGPVTSLAANIHLYCYCKFPYIRSNVLVCLQMELRALLLIQGKNKIVGTSLEGIIENISYMLRSASEQTMLLNRLSHQINTQRLDYGFNQTIRNFTLGNDYSMLDDGRVLAIADHDPISAEVISDNRETFDLIDELLHNFEE